MKTEDMKEWDERFAAWWSDRRVKLEEERRRGMAADDTEWRETHLTHATLRAKLIRE